MKGLRVALFYPELKDAKIMLHSIMRYIADHDDHYQTLEDHTHI